MKKVLLTIGLVLGSVIALSCPRPTSHAVVALGANYDYILVDKEWSKNLIALNGRIGWEESNRYVTICAVGGYAFGSKNWNAGAEIMVNPLGVRYGYDTPINFAFVLGSGYKSNVGAYTSVGLELSGSMGSVFTPFIRSTFDMNNLGNGMTTSIEMNIGFKLWLGKDW